MDETNFYSESAKQILSALGQLDCCPYCEPKQLLLPLNVSLQNQDVYEEVLRCHNCNSCFGKNGSTFTDITHLVDLRAEDAYYKKIDDYFKQLPKIMRKDLN